MEVRVNNLTKRFGKTTAVDQINITFQDGKLTGLLGPSGCGKSTTLYMIAGLESATEGQIIFGDQDVTTWMPEKRNIGLVFQNYALYPHMTLRENIAFPLSNMKDPETGKKYTRQKRNEMVEEIAKLVQIENMLDRKPGQLSGGQQQRVAIARALVKKPDVLLLDEPLSNLDARLRMEMRTEIRRIQQESKVTTIFVTHDQEEAMSITDEIVLMKHGVVQQIADPHEMYLNPSNDFVASFMGNPPISYVDVQVKDGFAVLDNGMKLPYHTDYCGAAKMGIRPEAWAVGGDIGVKLTDVEMRGQDQVVSFALGKNRIRAILNAEEYVRSGQEIGLRLLEKRCYLFHPETGVRL
ncbi:MAG: ABC transporter ATP-binding protein [Oscillospiraceae bacterium]|nr:ABC transporter ATP-binding protein [Oscillospiraceae bacterium]